MVGSLFGSVGLPSTGTRYTLSLPCCIWLVVYQDVVRRLWNLHRSSHLRYRLRFHPEELMNRWFSGSKRVLEHFRGRRCWCTTHLVAQPNQCTSSCWLSFDTSLISFSILGWNIWRNGQVLLCSWPIRWPMLEPLTSCQIHLALWPG